MKNGIVFIWSEKELLSEILKAMEKKEYVYIENLAMVLLDPLKALMNNDIPASKLLSNEKLKAAGAHRTKKVLPLDTISFESDTTSHTTVRDPTFDDKDKERVKVALDQKAFLEQVHQYQGLEANNLFLEKESDYFKISKRVLLMFRKVVEGKDTTLELRHQRTCDVFFNTVNPLDPYGTI